VDSSAKSRSLSVAGIVDLRSSVGRGIVWHLFDPCGGGRRAAVTSANLLGRDLVGPSRRARLTREVANDGSF
jgi:hypothetical protein